jgi:hypothetical protein
MYLAGSSPTANRPAPRDRSSRPHRDLVEALLHAGEPSDGSTSYALLWQRAASEQQRAGYGAQDAEQALEMLVTETLALSRTAPWFGSHPHLRDTAIEETIAYWTGATHVPSGPAHESWRRCWETRTRATASVRIEPAELAAAVADEQRLQREWADRWEAWSLQPAAATARAIG